MSIQTIHASRIRGLPKNNFNAITDPDNTTDQSLDYSVGSVQINVDLNKIYICVDSSLNNAIQELQGGVDATIIDRIDELEIDTTAIDDRVDVLEGAILDYHHIQVVASDTQYVVHNLGRYPAVTILDSSVNKEEVYGTVQHIDENRLNLIFGAAFSGEAFIK